LHALLDGFAVLVHLVQLRSHFPRRVGVIGKQAFDAQAHVVQAPGSVQARPEDKTQVGGGDFRVVTLGHLQNCLEPRPRTPGTNALKPLMNEDAVVGIQRHHVRHAAQGHQVQQLGDIWRLAVLVPAQAVQARPQGDQHIENHPDPRQRLARELAAGLVGVDDGIRGRQLAAWQVVVGDQHAQTGLFRRSNAFNTGNPVIDRNQQLRRAGQRDFDDFRGQAIAVFKPVGHQVIDMGRPQQTQTEHAHGAGRSAVGVKVADDQDALALLKRDHQQVHCSIDALELLIRNQPRQALVQFSLGLHTACGVQAGQQGWHFAQKRQGFRQWTRFDAHKQVESL